MKSKYTKVKLSELIDFDKVEYKWDKIESIAEFAKLKECKQNPKWHGEGDAFVHTQKVCEAMVSKIVDGMYSCSGNSVLLTAALFHDIGKGETTFFKEKDQNWHAYGHEIVGEQMVREMLADEDPEFVDGVAKLVRWHMEPLNIKKCKHKVQKMFELAKKVWGQCSDFGALLLLKKCDILGSEQQDKESWYDDLNFIKTLESVASTANVLDTWSDMYDDLLDEK